MPYESSDRSPVNRSECPLALIRITFRESDLGGEAVQEGVAFLATAVARVRNARTMAICPQGRRVPPGVNVTYSGMTLRLTL